METVRLLLIEDNLVDALCLKEALEESRYTKFSVAHVETLAEAKERLADEDFQVVVLDLGLPDSQGLTTFTQIESSARSTPIVVLSGLDDEVLAREAVRRGAQDYLLKDKYDGYHLSRSITYAVERYRLISDQRKVEEALRMSEQRFRAIFEGAEDCIFVIDRSLKYVNVNPAAERLLDLPASEIIGRRYEDLFGEEGADHYRETDLRVLEGETIEEECTRKVPVPGTFLDTKVPLRNDSGDIVNILCFSRDITGRKGTDGLRKASGEYRSKAMQTTLKSAMMAALTNSTVMLLGESGSGKDHLARYIHDHSNRAEGPYFSINCAAISHELAESELFGHERGSFTGAHGRKRGLLELAEGGTLLLNEIGELSLSLQSKLLTFLDSRSFLRVGGEKSITVNARIIAATHRNLQIEVAEGRFLSPLLYRLNVFVITVPPLRDRIEDIPILLEEIVSKLAKDLQFSHVPEIDPASTSALARYRWPGNVREFRNVLERSLILSDGKTLNVTLPSVETGQEVWSHKLTFPARGGTLHDVTDEVIKSLCLEALRRCDGNRMAAARRLGIARDSLYRHMKRFGIASENRPVDDPE